MQANYLLRVRCQLLLNRGHEIWPAIAGPSISNTYAINGGGLHYRFHPGYHPHG